MTGLEVANMENFKIIPVNKAELESFIIREGRDRIGTFHYLTGYEGTGLCFWCGGELSGRQLRYCRRGKGDDAHWLQYHQHFNWNNARAWCLERSGHRCANCGARGSCFEDNQYIRGTVSLEVHHILPLNASTRPWTPYNLPWNLISLCHDCHLEIHVVLRVASRPDLWDLAAGMGQGVFEEMLLLGRKIP